MANSREIQISSNWKYLENGGWMRSWFLHIWRFMQKFCSLLGWKLVIVNQSISIEHITFITCALYDNEKKIFHLFIVTPKSLWICFAYTQSFKLSIFSSLVLKDLILNVNEKLIFWVQIIVCPNLNYFPTPKWKERNKRWNHSFCTWLSLCTNPIYL